MLKTKEVNHKKMLLSLPVLINYQMCSLFIAHLTT